MQQLRVSPIRFPRFEPGERVFSSVVERLRHRRLTASVVVVASKLVSYDQERVVPLQDAATDTGARALARRFRLSAKLAARIRREATRVLGGVPHAVLTDVRGDLTVNAGIDTSNTPAGTVVLWPEKPWLWAARLRAALRNGHSPLGVVISDSHCVPRRNGTTGMALAIAGFRGVRDVRGTKDLYNKPMHLTVMNIADDLASAAHLLQGEAAESFPIAVVANAPVEFTNANAHKLSRGLRIAPRRDLFTPLYGTKTVR